MRAFTPGLPALLLLVVACGSTEESSSPAAPGDETERRYREVLSPGALDRATLRELLASEEPLLRNAAARALCDRGEKDAAAALVANLHRDRRTYVTVDAIHHLEAIFGTDLGYEPNLGYRHQTEKQAEWRDFLGLPPAEEPEPQAAEPDPDLQTLADAPPEDPGVAHAMLVRAWRRLGELAPDRHPAVVARVEKGFEILARRRPDLAALWNNHGLSALNNGHPEAARASYRRALALEPDDAGLRNDMGILLEGLGRLEEAERSYRRATELRPDDDVPWANLGDVLRKRGRPGEAIAAYREAERLAPEKWYYHRVWIRRLEGALR
jgi:Flp pilus assembly protein TadD